MLLSGKVILDVTHNNVVKKAFFDNKAGKTRDLWLHRKGAAPAEVGSCVVIPGSRGAFSYLVEPQGDQEVLQNGGFSLAHGAGKILRFLPISC